MSLGAPLRNVRGPKTRLAFRGVSHNSTTFAAFVKTLALLTMLTGLATAIASTLSIHVLRMNSKGLQADRESSGKGIRTKQLASGSNRLKIRKGTLEPLSNLSGS